MIFFRICILILQAEYLRKMEADNLQEAQKLRVLIEQGEKGLNKLQEALVDIAQSQLEARKIEVVLNLFIAIHSSI